LHKLSLSRLAAAEDAGAEDAGAEAVEGARSAAVAVGATVARVEWEEADAAADTAGLRCRVVTMAAEAPGPAKPGTCRDPAATAQVVWLRTGMSPVETSTDPKPPPRFNPARKALGPVFLRLLKEIGLGRARAATKGSRILRTKLAAVNSLGEVKELGAASSQGKSKAVRVAGSRAVNWARWREVRWRGAQSAPV
jgi:hypothetical protein